MKVAEERRSELQHRFSQKAALSRWSQSICLKAKTLGFLWVDSLSIFDDVLTENKAFAAFF